jgi:hypothetical protein
VKKPHGRPSCRWLDNIEINIKEIRCEDVEWMNLVQARGQWWALVDMVMNILVP